MYKSDICTIFHGLKRANEYAVHYVNPFVDLNMYLRFRYYGIGYYLGVKYS